MEKKVKVSVDDWETSPDEVLLETPIMKLKSGLVKNRKTGRQRDFYSFDFPDWVNIIAVTEAGEMVLIEQFRYGSKKIEVEIPGGMIEPGESPVVAGCRELLEETGFSGENARLLGRVNPNPALQANWCYTVLVENTVCSNHTNMDDMEDIDTVLKPVSEVYEMVRRGEISHGLVLNALMFFEQITNG